MPKKKEPTESAEAQSERFKQAVRDAEAAGTLSPTEAEAALDQLVRKAKTAR